MKERIIEEDLRQVKPVLKPCVADQTGYERGC